VKVATEMDNTRAAMFEKCVVFPKVGHGDATSLSYDRKMM